MAVACGPRVRRASALAALAPAARRRRAPARCAGGPSGAGGAVAGVALAAALGDPARALAETASATLEKAPDFVVDLPLLGSTAVSHESLLGYLVLGQVVGFVGASVTGVGLRRRKKELEVLNATLVAVNAELRQREREAKAGVKVNLTSDGERVDADAELARFDVVARLKAGKKLLRECDEGAGDSASAKALAVFEGVVKDLRTDAAIRESLDCAWKAERKAERGASAALRRLGRLPEAITKLKHALVISVRNDDPVGVSDALGSLADVYTETDDLEAAGIAYDAYLQSLSAETDAEILALAAKATEGVVYADA